MESVLLPYLTKIGCGARMASRSLNKSSSSVKTQALNNISQMLSSRESEILIANQKDMDFSRSNGLADSALDRLLITSDQLESIVSGVRQVNSLVDPLLRSNDTNEMPNGLILGKIRVPLGVVCAIYESRPNVTVDIAALCIKSGNAVILRGGKEAFQSNKILTEIIRDSVEAAGLPRDTVQLIESTERSLVGELLKMKEYIDLVIPRGGAELVHRVDAEATMASITGGVGVCHIYVDAEANLDMAVKIASNAKMSRPYVCNALDTLIVHSAVAPQFLSKLYEEWKYEGIELKCDRRTLTILGDRVGISLKPATDDDWGKEFLSLTAAIRIVDSLDEALEHIDEYTSGHTEAIVSDNKSSWERFLTEVDSGVVMVNASTRFNDGGQFGLGAEVGISTNKLHARGPIGLKELTTYKWTVKGDGQVRI